MSIRLLNILKLLFLFLIVQLESNGQSGSFGNTFIHNEGESVIFGMHDFEKGSGGAHPGIIGTDRNNNFVAYGILGFSDVSPGWTGAADDSYVDGYVKKYGVQPFVFPIGDNGKYRPIAISGADETTAAYYKVDPAIAITDDLYGGNYNALPSGGPFDRASKSNLIVDISDKEYWDVDGSAPARISLSWDIFSEIDRITNNHLDHLTIVGWDGEEWVIIPSQLDFLYFDINRSQPVYNSGLSSFTRGSITTSIEIVPDQFSIITFGTTVSGSIGDLVWEDMNRDGIQDIGEPGIEGIKVELFLYETDSLYMTVFTDVNGRYLMPELPAETYYLQLYPHDGFAPTLPFQGQSSSRNSDLTFQSTIGPFNLAENEKKFDLDGGYYQTGRIGDLVWLDLDNDGVQDENESGVEQVRVELYRDGEPELLASTITSDEGIYTFTNIPPGFYIIKIVPPLNHNIGPYRTTFDGTKDSDIIPLTGRSEPIELTSGQIQTDIDAALSAPCTYEAEFEVVAPICGVSNGSIDVIINGASAPYFFEWNTGDTTSYIENIDTGRYTVLIRDRFSCHRAMEVFVDFDEACNLVCADINTHVFLEGTYDYDEQIMKRRLNELGYLPGQMPTTFLGKYTEAGHPYNDEPWYMGSTEGMTFESTSVEENNDHYPEDIVDWVLVSVRARENVEYEMCVRPALLHENGHISFVNDDCCLLNPLKEYFVVIEHRNHLIVMSPEPQPLVDGELTFDFRAGDSYRKLFGYGQKEIAPGVFGMFAANGEQYLAGESSVDINVNDISEWLRQNGEHSSYYRHDFDLNGDANVQDKGMYLKNIGIFTDVPKGN